MPTILIVDDELSMREFLKIFLEKEGYSVQTAADGNSALKIIKRENVDLVVSDIKMEGMGGLDLLSSVKEISSLPFILITAFASPEDAVSAMKYGAFDYLTKPFQIEELIAVIRSALASSIETNAVSRDGESENGFRDIVGNSRTMRQLFDRIKKIGPTHANVLIYGESGTGKELVAKAIHQQSEAAARHFVPVICNAIPETLFESELFGYRKGAFTGADTDKTGLLVTADQGTAFFDEIGELSPQVQTKLLRFLQEREVKRVGDNRARQVNVRIISATNRDLEEEIRAERFREDLYYRLAVVPMRVPPLRERKEDIPLLADYFLRKYSQAFNKEAPTLSSYALEVLMGYDFPGNVRELENIIERGVAMATSNLILPESLNVLSPSSIKEDSAEKRTGIPSVASEKELFEHGLEKVMVSLEKEFIQLALQKAGNSKMKAADLLQISFRSLRYKIKKYNIE
ncbi:MAG: sigma-54-dependent transcriptional regulator [Desulfurivibrionaceae bacterium]